MRRTANEAHELMHHRFPPGDKVRLNGPTRYTNAASGLYNIVGLLPERDGELQYRIKSDLEGYHRVVRESQVAKTCVASTIMNIMTRGEGHVMVTVHRDGRTSQAPLGGSRKDLDPRDARRVCEELGLDWSDLPGPKSRV